MGDASQTLTFAMVWQVLSPELILVGAGFLMLILDLLLGKQKGAFAPWVGSAAIVVSAILVCSHLHKGAVLPLAIAYSDDFSNAFNLLFLAGGLLTVFMSIDYLRHADIQRAEYSYLVLFATAGAMLMASSLDLITLFVGLELLSISTYILVAMRRGYAKSAEGALKYLIIGSIASALILYGMSFVYGLTGSTNIYDALQQTQTNWSSYKFLTLLSLVLMLAGLGIKISLAPFHMWAPDTYEGAPTPITAYLSVVSKAAGFAMLIRLYFFGYLNLEILRVATPYLIVLAVLTMAAGNIAALSQRNMKRILAYSSIAQAGYILVPLCTLGHATTADALYQMLSTTIFYLAAYLVMTYGAFSVLAVVTRDAGNEEIDAFSSLFARSPFLAASMAVFLLSMAGMPFTGGFLGKFYIFTAAIGTKYYFLAAVLFATSVISFYYYFGIIKAMFTPYKASQLTMTRVNANWTVSVVVVLTLAATFALGIVPQSALAQIQHLNWFGGGQ